MNKRGRIGPDCPNYRGGKRVAPHGYVVLSSKEWGADVGRYEHRVVMEATLGRRLERWEIVPHRNGDKQDNRPENLTVVTRQAHNREHHGRGRELVCRQCGARKWYDPANIARMTPETYRCRKCRWSA